MNFRLLSGLDREALVRQVPARFRPELEAAPLGDAPFALLQFASTDEITLSRLVQKALAKVPPGQRLVATAHGFTAEGLELLRAAEAVVLTESSWHWTDESYDRIRQLQGASAVRWTRPGSDREAGSTMAEALERAFEDRGVRRGGILLLAPGDAIALVREARGAGVAVLGIEGFEITPGATRPRMDEILDCSAAEGVPPGGWDAAERFLAERRESGLMFEVCLA